MPPTADSRTLSHFMQKLPTTAGGITSKKQWARVDMTGSKTGHIHAKTMLESSKQSKGDLSLLTKR